MDVFRGLLHDTSGDGPAHRAARERPDGWATGPLVVGDERLSGLDGDVDLSVLISGGAGGLTALARRATGLRIVSVETVLRDLDDLAGAASRVVAAAAGLTDEREELGVFVGLPSSPGLVDAVEVVEAAGLLGRVDLAADTGGHGRAELLSVLVEADLPFKVAGLGTAAFGPYGVVAVLMAVEALVDGADPADAEELLARPDVDRARNALAGWDAAQQARVARRLRGVDCADVAGTLDTLTEAGVLDPTD